MRKAIKRVTSIIMVIAMILTVNPLAVMRITAYATAKYMWPVLGSYGVSRWNSSSHYGVDITNSGNVQNPQIIATYSGTVTAVYNSCSCTGKTVPYYDKNGKYIGMVTCTTHRSTYGNCVVIANDDGTTSVYGHLKYNSIQVSVGTRVSPGQNIGLMGDSGCSTGIHLHFEIRSGSTQSTCIDLKNTEFLPANSTAIEPPQTPNISINKNILAVGETASLTWSSCETATYYWISCWSSTSQVINEQGYNNYKEISFSTPGKYSITVVAGNNQGETIGNWIDIVVYDSTPQAPDVSLNKPVLAVGETASLTWSSCETATYYWISCWDSASQVINEQGYNNYKEISFSTPGKYSITVVAGNNQGETIGNWIDITVYNPNITISLDSNGGYCSTNNLSVTYGSAYGSLPIPIRDGYIFEGWFTSKDGGEKITATATVDVINEITLYAHWEHDTFIVSENATVTVSDTNKLIYGENLLCMSEYDLLDLFKNDNASVIMESSRISTGTTVNLIDDSDEIYDTLTVVIFGDVDGDGFYDGSDAYKVNLIVNGWLTREQVGEAAWAAADCNHDGVIDELDVALLERAGLLLSQIDQSKPQSEIIASDEYIEYQSLIDQSPEPQAEEPDVTPDPEPETEPTIFEQIILIIKQVVEFILSFVKRLYK